MREFLREGEEIHSSRLQSDARLVVLAADWFDYIAPTPPKKGNTAVNQEHQFEFRVITAHNEAPSSTSVSQIRPLRLNPLL